MFSSKKKLKNNETENIDILESPPKKTLNFEEKVDEIDTENETKKHEAMMKYAEEQKLIEEEKLREEEELRQEIEHRNQFVNVYGEIPANSEGEQYNVYYPSLNELVDEDNIHNEISQYIAMKFLKDYPSIPKSTNKQLLLNRYIRETKFNTELNDALLNNSNVKDKIYFANPNYNITKDDINTALELISLNVKVTDNPLNTITPKKLRDRTKVKPIEKYSPTKSTKGGLGGFVTTKRGKNSKK